MAEKLGAFAIYWLNVGGKNFDHGELLAPN